MPSQRVFAKKVVPQHARLQSEPGTKGIYTNFGYLLLGAVIWGMSILAAQRLRPRVRRRYACLQQENLGIVVLSKGAGLNRNRTVDLGRAVRGLVVIRQREGPSSCLGEEWLKAASFQHPKASHLPSRYRPIVAYPVRPTFYLTPPTRWV